MKIEIDYTPADLSTNHHLTFGNDLSAMLKAGIRYAKDGSRSEARHLLLKVTDAEPDNEAAWLWLASISEYPEELLVFLQHVLRINPENQRAIEWTKATKSLLADTFVRRGVEASEENRKEFANQCFMQALLHNSQHEMAWLWLASNSDSFEEKKAHLQKVLSINPENETALASLQSLQLQLTQQLLKQANFAAISGDREEARKLLEEAMREAPELEEAWILKAYLADTPEEKIACYEKVLALNPANETAQAGLASLEALNQRTSGQKSNAEMLRQFFEAGGAEVLSADSLSAYPQAGADETDPQKIKSLETAGYQLAENLPAYQAEVLVAETYGFSDSDPASPERPTEELNVNFVEEDNSQEVSFAEAGFSESFASGENLPGWSEPAGEKVENNDPFFALPESDEEFQTDSDEVLRFVREAEARLLNGEEAETFYFESPEETEEATEFDSFVLPDVADYQGYQTSSAADSGADHQAAEQLPQFDNHSYSNEAPFSGHDVLGKVNSAEPAQMEPPPAAPIEQVESYEQAVEAVSAQARREEVTESSLEEAAESSLQKSLTLGEAAPCSFCYVMNEPHTIVCHSCRTMLSLSDLETLLSYTDADPGVLEMAIEDLENERAARALTAGELTILGIAYLNAKNLRKALNCLQEASQLSPNDVVLASKVNFLAIRLSEIEVQESKMESLPLKNLTVMVVDDSPTVRKLISGKLEKCGHTVLTAADGPEALGKIKEVVPDLILLDIMMPEMDGYQVCKLIRSNEPTKNVPVVMISGKEGFFDKVRGRMAGTTGYITKPFGPETLMRTIETYVS